MEFSEVLHGRRSIRKYKLGIKIPCADKKAILEAAMLAPSACNTRPWEFLVVESEDIKEKLSQYKPQVASASFCVVVCARPDRQSGISEGYWPQDCGAAVENMLLKAYDLGYGSCWGGVYPREERVAAFKEILGVTSVPFAVVTFGVSDEAPEMRGFYDETAVKTV